MRHMKITTIKRVSMPVTDQDRAKSFYTDTLGFELVREIPVPMGENARWIEVAPSGASTTLILGTWFEMSAGSVSGLMLESSDVDADAKRLADAGVQVDGPNPTPWGKQAAFRDPDGNEFVLAEPTPQG